MSGQPTSYDKPFGFYGYLKKYLKFTQLCMEMKSSIPAIRKKVNVLYTMDYQDNIHEKIIEKTYLLKICTATVLIHSTMRLLFKITKEDILIKNIFQL